jgi:DNA helicase-2/ATP-dependent DNA helicase PcrA
LDSSEHFRILALTFTNKAANEMKDRLTGTPAVEERTFVGTLHSFCMEVLGNRGSHFGIDRLPNIFESFQDRKQVLREVIAEDPELLHLLKERGDLKEQEKTLAKWLEKIGAAKNSLLVPEMIEDRLTKRIYEIYDDGLRACNALDFDDLLLLTYRLFLERPGIADFYRRQYRYICVDEAQDLNEAQYQVLRALCGDAFRNVMMVGDPKQAIFVWNGADPKYLDLFEKDFGAKKISMTENFRSSGAVVDAARALDPEYRLEGQLPIRGDVKLLIGENEEDEARQVLNYIDQLMKDGHPDVEDPITLNSCALLGRTRYVLGTVESEIKKRGWVYYKQVSSQHESESSLLRDFELCLKVLGNPRDQLHLGMLVKNWDIEGVDVSSFRPKSGLDVLHNLQKRTDRAETKVIVKAVDQMNWSESDFRFLNALDFLARYAKKKTKDEDRALILQDIRVWRQHWDAFIRAEQGGSHNVPSFLSQVALGATQQPKQDGLALLTIHSAKGLEFDVVIVMGMAEGTFPDYRATGSALQEEKRNAFVAITRSKRLLALSYPETKVMPWGDMRSQKPSRYLEMIGLLAND